MELDFKPDEQAVFPTSDKTKQKHRDSIDRRKRLIQAQHPYASRVEVMKLHGGFSGSMVLQTQAFDAGNRP